MHFVPGSIHAIPIIRIDDEDEALSVLVVMPPKGADFILPSDVPYGEGDVAVFDGLDVESDGGDCGYYFAELEFVEDCCLSGGVEADLYWERGRRGEGKVSDSKFLRS
jgi:hypothetical protein